MGILVDDHAIKSLAFLVLIGAVVLLEGYQIIVLGGTINIIKDLALMAAGAFFTKLGNAAG